MKNALTKTSAASAAPRPNHLGAAEAKFIGPMEKEVIERDLRIRLLDAARAEIAAVVAECPSPQVVEAQIAERERLLTQASTRNEAVALLSMLFDAFPHGRPTDGFLDALLNDVIELGFSASIIALACRELRRTCRFMPSIAEVIAACEKAKDTLERRLSNDRFAAKLLREAHDRLRHRPTLPILRPKVEVPLLIEGEEIWEILG